MRGSHTVFPPSNLYGDVGWEDVVLCGIHFGVLVFYGHVFCVDLFIYFSWWWLSIV